MFKAPRDDKIIGQLLKTIGDVIMIYMGLYTGK